jgi:hypothetical protein
VMNPISGATGLLGAMAYGKAVAEDPDEFEPIGEAEAIEVPLTFRNVMRRLLGLGPTAEHVAAHLAANEPVAEEAEETASHSHAPEGRGCHECGMLASAEFARTYDYARYDEPLEPERKLARPKPVKRDTTRRGTEGAGPRDLKVTRPKAKRNTDAWQAAIAAGRERRRLEKEAGED